jgi:hypothetical protein
MLDVVWDFVTDVSEQRVGLVFKSRVAEEDFFLQLPTYVALLSNTAKISHEPLRKTEHWRRFRTSTINVRVPDNTQ